MNKEELIGKLQMVYVGDKNALNELIGYYDGLKEIIKMTQEENDKLKKSKHKAIENIKQLEHSDWLCFGRDILLDILENK